MRDTATTVSGDRRAPRRPRRPRRQREHDRGAIGDENVALARALDLLPATLRKANTTFVNLRATLDDLDVLVDGVEARHARTSRRFLRALRPLVRDARPDDRRPAPADPQPGPEQRPDRPDRQAAAAGAAHRDRLPALDPHARQGAAGDRVRARLHARLRRLDHASSARLAANYDANGHYARIQPMFKPSTSRRRRARSTARRPPASASSGLETRQSHRCPGGATQPPPDGSAPARRSDGCDPATTPPGP